ncbi:MAG TPA: hypothetical protein VK633_13755 [Verrucomicrobiae bacterium]|nr:hypothetical protein [Verrucomicrobiae bacterium]
MKKLLFLIATVSALFIGCSKQDDMSSPPASSGGTSSSTNSATSTNH